MPKLTHHYLEEGAEVLTSRGHPVETESEEFILGGIRELGDKLGYENLERSEDIEHLIELLHHRFCGVPDTPPQTSGPHILDYGTPIGRWSRGALTVGVNPAGYQTVDFPVMKLRRLASTLRVVYDQYSAAAPFFNFTFLPVGSGGDINVQFGGDPTLGTIGGPIGIGSPPESGSLKLDANTVWNLKQLISIMLHEAGHTLGLSHSTNPASVMYPFATGLQTLDAETIEAIQSMYGWTSQAPLSDRASSHGPSLAVVSSLSFGGASQTLFMAWKGTEGDSSLWWSQSSDGKAWTAQQHLPDFGSSEGPCLAAYHMPSPDGLPREGLFMAWKGVGGDHNIYWATNPNLDGWTGQQSIAVGTSARPALVEFNNQVVLAWKGVPGDSGIYWSKFDGVNKWSTQQQIAGRGTSDSPMLCVFSGQLHMFWKGIDDDNTVYHAVLVDPANGIWGPQQQVTYTQTGNLAAGETPVPIGTSAGPSGTVRGSELVLMWKGVPDDHEIWFSRFNGSTFSGQISIPNVGTESYPAIANLNGRLVAVWRGIGDDHQLWTSSLG